MKILFLWLLFTLFVKGQDNDPFEEIESIEGESDEMIYDFADLHKWDDVFLKEGGPAEQKIITWGSSSVASHKGVAGKTQILEFSVEAKAYEKSLRHLEFNRGMVLIAGDTRFPLLQCWLRPLSVQDGKALFAVNIPVERLKEMHIAFIPSEGKKRYLYSLSEVAISLKKRSGSGVSPK
jgi:hypothetical protein